MCDRNKLLRNTEVDFIHFVLAYGVVMLTFFGDEVFHSRGQAGC